MTRLTFGSVFTGIGGLDLGLERAGMTCRWQIENDPYAAVILERHWPQVRRYGDIHDVRELEGVDLICGGVPCQPWSNAGPRTGQDDARDLWPEFWRVCLLVRPRFIVVEEVPGFAIPDGLGRTLSDLARAGFHAEWFHLSAASVGAPHLRRRLFLVAYTAREFERIQSGRRRRQDRPGPSVARDDGTARTLADTDGQRQWEQEGRKRAERRRTGDGGTDVADTDGSRRQERTGDLRDERRRNKSADGRDVADADGAGLAVRESERGDDGTQRQAVVGSGLLGDADGTSEDAVAAGRGSRSPTRESGWWDVEPDVGRVADGIPSRMDRLRCLGNAVVPQVAEVIGRLIVEAAGDEADE